MRIELNNPKTLPVVVLDNLFIKSVTVSVDEVSGEYIVRGLGIPSGKDVNGKVILDPDSSNYQHLNDDTFLATAIGYAIAKGECVSPTDFMSQVATETATINSSNQTVAQSLAHYVAGIAKIFEISGTDIKGLK